MKFLALFQLFSAYAFASFFSPYHEQKSLCLLKLLEARELHEVSASVSSERLGPIFPKKDGWLGADAAYTVKLPNGKIVWLFGDTFLGSSEAGRGFERFIDNSIGITKGEPPFENPSYIWDRSVKPYGDSYFKSKKPNHKLWPKAGFYLNGSLYVFLVEVRVLSEAEVSANEASLGFEEVGISLGRVQNILEPQSKWKSNVYELTTSLDVFLGTSVIVQDGYIYSFSTAKESQGQSLVLHRIAVDNFLLSQEMGFEGFLVEHLSQVSSSDGDYSNEGVWRPGLESPGIKRVVDRGATELSVHWDKRLNKWLMIQSEPMAHDVWIRWADRLEGPWSQPQTVFQYPETLENNSIFAYAAKAHPHYSEGGLFFTYVTNLLDEKGLEQILSDLSTYTPIGVKLSYQDLKGLIQNEEAENDKYSSFSELKKENTENVDYRIEAAKRRSSVLSMAIHGGKIEFGTSTIAREVAGEDHSYYLFEGLKDYGNRSLHITSTRFDEPHALELLSSSSACISFHGYKDDQSSQVCIGGANYSLSRAIYNGLSNDGLIGDTPQSLLQQSTMNPCGRFYASNSQNVVNRCQTGGVQIEMSSKLRRHLMKNKEAREAFVNSIRASLRGYLR